MSNAEPRFADSSPIGVSIHSPSSIEARLTRRSRRDLDGSGAPAARRRALATTSLLALLVAIACAVLAAPASAQLAHPTISHEVGPDGTSATAFSYPIGDVAYQQANQRLYLGASNNLYGFSNPSPGTFTPLGGSFPFSLQSNYYSNGIAVDNSSGASANNIYFASGPTVAGFDETSAPLAGWPVNDEFRELCDVAVDSEGNVWGAEYGSSGGVAEWAPSGGSPIRRLETVPLAGEICKIAVDRSNDDVYVSSSSNGNVYRFSAASGYTETTVFPGTGAQSPIVVDAQHHTLFVASTTSKLLAFDTVTGRAIETNAEIGYPKGIAVQESTGTVFVSAQSWPNFRVEVLEPVEVPKSITEEPTGNHQVSGLADPDGAGEITECFFEWGASASYGNTEECDESTPISSAEPVHATLPGLIGEQTYHYRLVLKNANGAAYGEDETIVPHNVIGMHTLTASDVSRTTARLNGTFEGTGEETTYYFEYGTTETYGSRWPEAPGEESTGVTTGTTPMSAVVSNLEPETTYHYRVVAENEKGKNIGEDSSFTTQKAVAGLVTGEVTDVTKTSATLHGTFTGNGEAHTFYFEWGSSDSYGNTTPVESAGSGVGTIPVSASLNELEIYLPDQKLYHYRVVATNAVGTTRGPDRTFHTLPPDPPVISGVSAAASSPTSATVKASINPGEGETVYAVEYGPTTGYGSSTPLSESIGEDSVAHAVSSQLTGLTPGTTYHVRVVAFNFTGTTHGSDVVVSTPDAPAILTSSGLATGPASAHLSASVLPNSSATSAGFEYGPSTAYGQTTAMTPVGAGTFAQPLNADLSGLVPGTTYHYRVVATNAIGTAYGPDKTLVTAAPRAVVPPPAANCGKFAQLARKNFHRAKKLRAKAKSANANRARKLRRKAAKAAKKGRQLSARATACRGSSGGGS